eukprot:Skav230055  [mRNA]  locus=scaffold1221:67729:71730:+ [translate_table: standard]
MTSAAEVAPEAVPKKRKKVVKRVKATGERVTSPPLGPAFSYRCRLLVFPAGIKTENDAASRRVSGYVEVLPPKHLRGDNWTCPDVRYEISIPSHFSNKPDVRLKDTFSFHSTKGEDRGWHNLLKNFSWSDYVSPSGKVRIQAMVYDLPYVEAPPQSLFPGLDFSTETRTITFRLAPPGPSLYFDQQLLMARSEYFRKMLMSEDWQESKRGEVDFTGDPQVECKVMQAILHFILTDSFDAQGSSSFAIDVRKLADRFCLSPLVQKADAELQKMLTDETVLKILAETHDTGSEVESSCWQMLEADDTILAKHEDLLDSLIASKPTLARKLILLGRTKRPRTS